MEGRIKEERNKEKKKTSKKEASIKYMIWKEGRKEGERRKIE